MSSLLQSNLLAGFTNKTKIDFSPECSFSAKNKYKNKNNQSQYAYIEEYVVAVIMIFTPIMNLYFLLLCFPQTPEASRGK